MFINTIIDFFVILSAIFITLAAGVVILGLPVIIAAAVFGLMGAGLIEAMFDRAISRRLFRKRKK